MFTRTPMNNPKRTDIFNYNYEKRKNEFVYSKITTPRTPFANQHFKVGNKENNKNIVNIINNKENTNNKRIIKEDNATNIFENKEKNQYFKRIQINQPNKEMRFTRNIITPTQKRYEKWGDLKLKSIFEKEIKMKQI